MSKEASRTPEDTYLPTYLRHPLAATRYWPAGMRYGGSVGVTARWRAARGHCSVPGAALGPGCRGGVVLLASGHPGAERGVSGCLLAPRRGPGPARRAGATLCCPYCGGAPRQILGTPRDRGGEGSGSCQGNALPPAPHRPPCLAAAGDGDPSAVLEGQGPGLVRSRVRRGPHHSLGPLCVQGWLSWRFIVAWAARHPRAGLGQRPQPGGAALPRVPGRSSGRGGPARQAGFACCTR